MSRPYAVAAFRQASEEGKVSQWADMLSLLTTIYEDATMKGLIANPKVARAGLEGMLLDVEGDSFSDTGKNFVRLLVENDRLGLAAEIERQFARERAAVEGRRDVTVISAFELSDAERDILVQRIAKRLGELCDCLQFRGKVGQRVATAVLVTQIPGLAHEIAHVGEQGFVCRMRGHRAR